MDDKHVYNLVFEIVKKGILEVVEAKSKDNIKMFQGYTNYPTLSYRKNGFPSIYKSPYGNESIIDFKRYFKINTSTDENKIDLIKYEEYNELNYLLKDCEKFVDVYGLSKEKELEILDFSLSRQIIDLICKIVLEYGELNVLTKQQFEKIYKPLENRVTSDNLSVDIYVPILFMKFECEEYKLTDTVSIVKMSDVFQKSRSEITSYSEGIPEPVLMSATHALKLTNYSIANMNNWISRYFFEEIDNYPLEEINGFFNTLRIKNFLTGYAQIIAKPIDWTERYKADLLDLKGTSVRMYPIKFNDYYWNQENFPVVNNHQLIDIQRMFMKLISKENKKITLACSRLENSFYRNNEGDKIIDIVIGLESILSDREKGEVTHKLSLRAAFLLQYSSLKKTKLEVYKNMKAIYDYRSAVVHGENQQKLNKKRLLRSSNNEEKLVVEVAESYLKECITILIHEPKFLNAINIDEDLILGNA